MACVLLRSIVRRAPPQRGCVIFYLLVRLSSVSLLLLTSLFLEALGAFFSRAVSCRLRFRFLFFACVARLIAPLRLRVLPLSILLSILILILLLRGAAHGRRYSDSGTTRLAGGVARREAGAAGQTRSRAHFLARGVRHHGAYRTCG